MKETNFRRTNMLQKHEIIGSELPIIFEKENKHFTHEELIYLKQDLKEFEHVAFLPTYVGNVQLFEKIYSKGV